MVLSFEQVTLRMANSNMQIVQQKSRVSFTEKLAMLGETITIARRKWLFADSRRQNGAYVEPAPAKNRPVFAFSGLGGKSVLSNLQQLQRYKVQRTVYIPYKKE